MLTQMPKILCLALLNFYCLNGEVCGAKKFKDGARPHGKLKALNKKSAPTGRLASHYQQLNTLF